MASRFDEYINASIEQEKSSRLKFFLNNSDKLFANAKVEGTKFSERLENLKREIIETNDEINRLNMEDKMNKHRSDPDFDMEGHRQKLAERFPELSDPRCFTHPMRPVPKEHTNALLTNTVGLGTEEYLKLRWSVPPKQRFYFRVPYSWDYGWHAPEPSNEKYFGRNCIVQNSFYRPNTLAMFIIDKQTAATTYW